MFTVGNSCHECLSCAFNQTSNNLELILLMKSPKWNLTNSKNTISFSFAHINGYRILLLGPLWSWLCGSWIYFYLCNQFLSPQKLWVRVPFMARCTRYNINVIKFVIDIRQVGGFLHVHRLLPPINLTATIITEILFKMV